MSTYLNINIHKFRSSKAKLYYFIGFSFIFFSVIVARSVGHAETQKVGAIWTICSVNCDFTTVQSAINDIQVAAGDTLQLKEAGPHTEAGILVDKNLTIEGLGTSFTVIQAADTLQNSTNRVFNIIDGVDVTIQNMTIRHGRTSGNMIPDAHGGGIRSGTGNLTMIDVHIIDNQTENFGSGGGIYNHSGHLNLQGISVKKNIADARGGGIYSSGSLEITNSENGSQISENETTRWDGGGVYHSGGPITISNVLFLNNRAAENGGGLHINAPVATLDGLFILLNRSGHTNLNNDAECDGAGIYNQSQLTISNSRIKDNIQEECSQGYGYGGGILHDSEETLTIFNSTVEKNQARIGGGGIYSLGPLYIEQSSINRNKSTNDVSTILGSGISTLGETLTLKDVNLHLNRDGVAVYISHSTKDVMLDSVDIWKTKNTAGYGGGLFINSNQDTNFIEIQNSLIRENESAIGGGMIVQSNFEGSNGPLNLSIIGSQIISNTVQIDSPNNPIQGQGGGLWLQGVDLKMRNSSVTGNYAESDGGGLLLNGKSTVNSNIPQSSTEIMNSTISGNSTSENGGGIYVDSYQAESVTIIHSTISNNIADEDGSSGANGGGIYRESGNFPVHLHNTIIAGNFDPKPQVFSGSAADCSGAFQTINHNMSQADTVLVGTLGTSGLLNQNPDPCSISGDGVQTGVSLTDLDLSPLQDNGGGTMTHALGANSVAIRSGQTVCSLYDIPTDQRGYARMNQCDIGAFEFGGSAPAEPTETPAPTATPTVTVTPTPPSGSTKIIYLPLVSR